MKFENQIPDDFRNGERPVVNNVKELRAELALLPDDLPVGTGWGDPINVSVTARNGQWLTAYMEPPGDGDVD